MNHISGPIRTDTTFIGHHGNIDAAFTLGPNKIYFIKGKYLISLSYSGKLKHVNGGQEI